MAIALSEPEIGALIAAFVRTASLVATAPVLGESGIPVRARVVAVVAIVLAVGTNRPGVMYADLPTTAALELAVGVITGLTARFVMARIAVAGQLMGLSLGLGFASEYDVRAGENAGVLRAIVTTLAGLVFLATGGLEAIVRAAAERPATLADVGALLPTLLTHATLAVSAGLALAAPIVIAAFVTNLGFAVLNRAAPAVNVFSVALSGVLIVGGLVLVASATGMLGAIASVVDTATSALSP
jgi:flagellar biosynthetic protein FliR